MFGNAVGNAAVAGIERENAISAQKQQAQIESTAQQMEANFSEELQSDIDPQAEQYVQAQLGAASEADFALMDAERGILTNGVAQYGTGFLEPLATMLNRSSAANVPMTRVLQSAPAEAGTPGFGAPTDVAYYDRNGELNIPIVAHVGPEPGASTGSSVFDVIESGVNNALNGALSTAYNMVYQPDRAGA